MWHIFRSNKLNIINHVMKQEQLLIKLYYLLVTADGEVDEKEFEMGQKMISLEGIDKNLFREMLEDLKQQNKELIYVESIKEMQQLTSATRIRYMAWMTLIANVDGFMDEREWQFIYKLYHKDLGLSLSDIMNKQKELNQLIRNAKPGGIFSISFCL